ncbi:hypothetical protein JTB14_007172 [Gonioctena quinquepunctata]|nr:hypothetical protein JTB14_007172 [Gonioctena quinquepunctata]
MAEDINKFLNEVKIQFEASDKKLKSYVPESVDIFEDLTAIPNIYETILNKSEELKQDIEERITIMNQNELIIDLLNYKLYEIRYEFSSKIRQLKEEKEKLEYVGVTGEYATEAAFKLVDIQKRILECEEQHESHYRTIKEQILQAQLGYENSVIVLDNSLNTLKKNFANLLLLTETHKAQFDNLKDIEEKLELEYLEEALDQFTSLQMTDWKPKKNMNKPQIPKGLKITKVFGMITYQEAKERNLLDHIISTLMKVKEKEEISTIPTKSGSVSESSGDTNKISSEDVAYLIEHLGTPLTLALAEITAVQPQDPIHYLGHWLFKYLYNQEVNEVDKIKIDQLTQERTRVARETWHKFVEEEAKAAIFDMIARAEEVAIKAELLRIERELIAQEEEEEALDDEARDKFGPYDENVDQKTA